MDESGCQLNGRCDSGDMACHLHHDGDPLCNFSGYRNEMCDILLDSETRFLMILDKRPYEKRQLLTLYVATKGANIRV